MSNIRQGQPYAVALKRQDSSSSWGFHLSGGRDYNHPLFVKKVIYNSLAERSGLSEGDEVVQVGRVNVKDKTLDEVHELIFRSGNDVDMIVIRPDSPAKTTRQVSRNEQPQQQSTVKAIVHAQYNSPLNLYSSENIAETISRTAELITEGPVSLVDFTGPDSVYPKPSAVLQLVQEEDYYRERYHGGLTNGTPDLSQESAPVQYTSTVQQNHVTSAPPTSAEVRSSAFSYPTSQNKQYKSVQPSPNGFYPPNELPAVHAEEYRPAEPRQVSSLNIGRQISTQSVELSTPKADYYKPSPPTPPPKPEPPNRTTSVCHVQLQQPQSPSYTPRPPVAAKMTPTSPTTSPSGIRRVRNLWPPKNTVVRELPKTGFSPSIVRGEQAQSKRFVWPPPRSDSESGRSTPSYIRHHGASIGQTWHPSESPVMTRTPPFCTSPVTVRRSRDDIWPPASWRAQQAASSVPRGVSPRPSKQLHEFDEFVTQHASLAVPPTYHVPPETQHFGYETYETYETTVCQ